MYGIKSYLPQVPVRCCPREVARWPPYVGGVARGTMSCWR